jgi:radical SAM protein with 4Fe4S-binding SPASM domain
MKQDSYETVTRKPGSYNAFKNGVSLLLDREVPFIVKSAILPPNKHEIDEFERWANTLPWMDIPPSYSFSFDLRGRRDSKSKNRQIEGLRLTPEEGLKIMTRDRVKYKKEMKQFCNNFIGPPGDELFNCGAGRSGCVDAYGMYQPCLLLRHPDLVYDLNKLTLREVLTIKFPNLKRLKAKNLLYLKRCANCFLKGLCEQCPAKSWSEHGTLDTPVEYLCKQAHVQACFLGLISDGEKAWQVDDWQERIKKI